MHHPTKTVQWHHPLAPSPPSSPVAKKEQQQLASKASSLNQTVTLPTIPKKPEQIMSSTFPGRASKLVHESNDEEDQDEVELD